MDNDQNLNNKNLFGKNFFLRVLLFTILGLFILYFTLPLFVMITTSLKSLEEIRTGSFTDQI